MDAGERAGNAMPRRSNVAVRRLVQRGAYPALLEEAAQGRGTAPLLSAGGFDTGHYSWEGLWGGG